MQSYGIYSLVLGFFHLICSFGPSALYVVVFHQFVFLYSLPLYNYTAGYLSLLLVMDFRVVSRLAIRVGAAMNIILHVLQ